MYLDRPTRRWSAPYAPHFSFLQRLVNGKNVPFDPSPPNLIDQWMESPEEMEGMNLITAASGMKTTTAMKRQCQDETPIVTSHKCHRTVLGPIRKLLMQTDVNRRGSPPTLSLQTPGKPDAPRADDSHHYLGKENTRVDDVSAQGQGGMGALVAASTDILLETPRKSGASRGPSASHCRRQENTYAQHSAVRGSGVGAKPTSSTDGATSVCTHQGVRPTPSKYKRLLSEGSERRVLPTIAHGDTGRRSEARGNPGVCDRNQFQSPFPACSMMATGSVQTRGINCVQQSNTDHTRTYTHTHTRETGRDDYTPAIGESPSTSYTQATMPSQEGPRAKSQSQPNLTAHTHPVSQVVHGSISDRQPDAQLAPASQSLLPVVGESQTCAVTATTACGAAQRGCGPTQTHTHANSAGSHIPCTPQHTPRGSSTVTAQPDTAMRESLRQKKDAALRRRDMHTHSQVTTDTSAAPSMWRSQSNPDMHTTGRVGIDINARCGAFGSHAGSTHSHLSTNTAIAPDMGPGSLSVNSRITGSRTNSGSHTHTAGTVHSSAPKYSQTHLKQGDRDGEGVHSQASVATLGSSLQMNQSQDSTELVKHLDGTSSGGGRAFVQPSPNTALKIALKQKKAAAIRRRKQAEKLRRQRQASQTYPHQGLDVQNGAASSGVSDVWKSSQSSGYHSNQRDGDITHHRTGHSQKFPSQR
ncbi:hypothetical protein SARC_04611 [Sphaeroforma arctica JP610]|uniref:Uncharacterized protein n=1 Tax=Sphaeroforma arctica JP610 TaxID=667725 RepID=A0A0L0G4H3_9EUKA|nr:hypothetical protein SARC_04611 [Sphaeroforma arctica JP610]KNC83113.1 hypothetical protein SARC_04611 [Sphaeroforma arctica JP610]|eukprot:XP_014157015.1 hypothetical protein SARC_04611 [Sphaeroforma arctica JP610]